MSWRPPGEVCGGEAEAVQQKNNPRARANSALVCVAVLVCGLLLNTPFLLNHTTYSL